MCFVFLLIGGVRVYSLLFGRRRVFFCCLGGGVCFFCCLGGVRFLFLLFGRGTGVHSLTGLPGSSLSDNNKKDQTAKKRARVPHLDYEEPPILHNDAILGMFIAKGGQFGY